MNRAHPLLPRLFLASAFAFSAVAAPPALSAPPAPAADPVTGKAMDQQHSDMIAAQPAACATAGARPVNVASDPEEGGQIARAAHKPKIGDMTVTKKMDKASTQLFHSSAPGSACP
jgi:type VI protein secretion system component Hcp